MWKPSPTFKEDFAKCLEQVDLLDTLEVHFHSLAEAAECINEFKLLDGEMNDLHKDALLSPQNIPWQVYDPTKMFLLIPEGGKDVPPGHFNVVSVESGCFPRESKCFPYKVQVSFGLSLGEIGD